MSTFQRCFVVLLALLSAFPALAQSDRPNVVQRFLGDLAFGFIRTQIERGTPLAESWVQGSPSSLALIQAYKAESLYAVGDAVVHGLDPDVITWQLAGPANGANQKAEAGSSDKYAQVRGFKVEITGATGKEVDTAWESVSGGEMIIEVTETTVGSDKFRTNSPGHKTVGDISLRGALLEAVSELEAWVDCVNDPTCRFVPRFRHRIILEDDKGEAARFEYPGEAFFLKDEVLFLWADAEGLHTTHLKVSRGDAAGQLVSAPPTLLFVSPNTAARGLPVLVASANHGPEASILFSARPTRVKVKWGKALPQLGTVWLNFATVPTSAPRGKGDVVVEYQGQQSNLFPFTIR